MSLVSLMNHSISLYPARLLANQLTYLSTWSSSIL